MEYVVKYTVKPKSVNAFRTWLVENERRLHEEAPAQWTYLGTFFALHRTAGYDCETRWRIPNYSALEPDVFFPPNQPTWGELQQDFMDFGADLPLPQVTLLKSPADVAVFESGDPRP